jgi:colanic acid biosynthesis glycosyl transferase WcaI
MFLPYYVLGVLRHKPIVYSVHDIYPDVGVKLGVFRHSTIIRLVGAMEDYCLSHAARVRILSTSFAPALEGRGVDADKIRLIYDYVDPEAITPLPRDNPFACEHGLDKRFVVLYTGNMGYVQALNSVIDAAHRLEEHQAIGFVFVGEGAAKASLIEQSQRLALDNVKFIGWQPAERMAEIYASGDICLVSLSKGMAEGALPSKSFSIMAAARVLLASVDPGSDAWDLVERSHAGIAVPPESPDALSEAVLRLYADPKLRQQMGRNGRNYVLEHHSPASAAQQFDELLVEAVESYNGREATHERSLPAD